MTTPVPVTPLPLEDYDAIEAAVKETQRGRWFLDEYARRNRNCDTDAVLGTLERIERTLRRERAAPDIDRIRLDLADMAEAISRTKQEIAQMKVEAEHGGRFAEASQELDAIVEQTETATNDILLAAEGIQEVAWTLREAGAAEDLCEKLDTHATDVYTACSFQDLTGQRTRKVVTVLRYLESRINAMIDIWGLQEADDFAPRPAPDRPFDPMDARPDAHLLNGPALQGRGVDQSEVDELLWTETSTAADEDLFAALPASAIADVEAIEVDDVPPAGTEPSAVLAEASALEVPEVETAKIEDDVAEEPAADVFATAADDRFAAPGLGDADVFAADDDLFEPVPEPEETRVRTTTVAVGNTLMTVTSLAETAADPAPSLALVTATDPIGDLSPERRLLTFG